MIASASSRSDSSQLAIDGNSLTLEQVERVALAQLPARLADSALAAISTSRQTIERMLAGTETIYGVNTGFGKFKDVRIAPEDVIKLQQNFIVSHAAGVGPYLDRLATRAMLLLRANALAKGFSGVRPVVIELLLACLEKEVHPRIPEQGSLGASGDLAPLAHLAHVLIGGGKAEYKGEIIDGAVALARAGLKPLVLEAKEGLALTNGTQFMTAIGTLSLLQCERLAKCADIIGAMSLEAQLGSTRAFSARIHAVRPHAGQMASATNLFRLLAASQIMESHANCPMVQDAYSLRCMPQVHGASRTAFAHTRQVLEIEINSATDNPLVYDDGVAFGGNFHGQPLALVLDYAATAAAELANISERRTERLVNPALSNGLPAFLTANGGLNSGYMIAQYTAASLVSENKVLAHPASVDSIPTSANQEDHVSMGAISARKFRWIVQNVQRVMAIELMCAAQGLDFRMNSGTTYGADEKIEHAGLLPGPGVLAAHKLVRSKIPHLDGDREVYKDIAAAEEVIASGELVSCVEKSIGVLV